MNATEINKNLKYSKSIRDHDYLYDSSFIVPSEKDHKKVINKAATNTAEVAIVPIFKQMFSELKAYPSIKKIYTPNAHLPDHIDLSYFNRINKPPSRMEQGLEGKTRFKFFSMPQKTVLINENKILDDVCTSSIQVSSRGMLTNKYVQTVYRESSTQTDPYQPEYIIRKDCKEIPEEILIGELSIDAESIKKGMNKSIIQWINRLRVRREWYKNNPESSVLAQLEFHLEKERKQEIYETLIEVSLDSQNYLEPLSIIYTEKPGRLWSCGITKVTNEKNRIQKNKERCIRKLEMKKSIQELKNYYSESWSPCIFKHIPFVTINPDFLPTLQKIESKPINIQNIKNSSVNRSKKLGENQKTVKGHIK